MKTPRLSVWSLGIGHLLVIGAWSLVILFLTPTEPAKLLHLRIVPPPRRVHVTDHAGLPLRRAEPVVGLSHRLVIVVGGDDLAVAAVGEELQRLVALAVVPVHDHHVLTQALPRAGPGAVDEVVRALDGV